MDDAQYILENSWSLDPDYCKIIDGKVYEKMTGDDDYRVFTGVDEYESIHDEDLIERLNEEFIGIGD